MWDSASSVRVNIFETFVWEAPCSFGLGNDRIFLQMSSLYQMAYPQTKHLETIKPVGMRMEWTRKVDALIICQRSEVHSHSMHQAAKTQSGSCRRLIRISNWDPAHTWLLPLFGSSETLLYISSEYWDTSSFSSDIWMETLRLFKKKQVYGQWLLVFKNFSISLTMFFVTFIS